jgi:hypothetical protein
MNHGARIGNGGALLAGLLASTLLGSGISSAADKGSEPALEVLERFSLEEPPIVGWVDVAWAGKTSVYLAEGSGQVTEVELAEGLPRKKSLTPSRRDFWNLGIRGIQHIAISSDWVVVAGPARVAWKRADQNDPGHGWQVAEYRALIHDIVIKGDRALVVGWPPLPSYEYVKNGGFVWEADLSKGLDSWEAIYESPELARDPEQAGTVFALSSLAILPKGGLVIAPSFVPEVLRLSDGGAVKERWSLDELLGKQQKPWAGGQEDLAKIQSFLRAGATADTVLGLPEGAAVLVREPVGGGVRYRLAVLGAEVRWYTVPMKLGALARIRADVDAEGRIVLIGVNRTGSSDTKIGASEMIVARLPL